MFDLDKLPEIASNLNASMTDVNLKDYRYIPHNTLVGQNDWYETIFRTKERHNYQSNPNQLEITKYLHDKASLYKEDTGNYKEGRHGGNFMAGFLVVPTVKQVLDHLQTIEGNLPHSNQSPSVYKILRAEEIKDVSVYIVDRLEHCGMQQAASQLNALEMIDTFTTPIDGITNYINDMTQGPAVALTAAPALHMRNYWVTNLLTGQLNTLHELRISHQNGYLIWGSNSTEVFKRINGQQENIRVPFSLYAQVIGIHRKMYGGPLYYHATDKLVHQAYTSTVPIATYGNGKSGDYSDQMEIRRQYFIAYNILVAQYKALIGMTLIMWHYDKIYNRVQTNIPTVDLTFIGTGIFNNPADMVMAAIAESMVTFQQYSIEYRLHAFIDSTVRAAIGYGIGVQDFDSSRATEMILNYIKYTIGYDGYKIKVINRSVSNSPSSRGYSSSQYGSQGGQAPGSQTSSGYQSERNRV